MFAVEAYAIHDGYCKRSYQMTLEGMARYRAHGDFIFKEILEYLATYRKHLPKWKRVAMYKGVRVGSASAVKSRRKELKKNDSA